MPSKRGLPSAGRPSRSKPKGEPAFASCPEEPGNALESCGTAPSSPRPGLGRVADPSNAAEALISRAVGEAAEFSWPAVAVFGLDATGEPAGSSRAGPIRVPDGKAAPGASSPRLRNCQAKTMPATKTTATRLNFVRRLTAFPRFASDKRSECERSIWTAPHSVIGPDREEKCLKTATAPHDRETSAVKSAPDGNIYRGL